MQTRPYPEKDGQRIWLSQREQQQLLRAVEDEPRRRIAIQLGLHGLRTSEILQVTPGHVRELANGADGHVLVVPDGKTGKREVPIDDDLVQRIRYLKSAARMTKHDPLVDVTKRSVRNWISDARGALQEEDAKQLGMHDLRRTWATVTYYLLSIAGVPIAEQLTMSWGGWKQTTTGRETFRQNYLGPVPDQVTARTMEHLFA